MSTPQIRWTTWVLGRPRVMVLGLDARWGDSIPQIVESLGGICINPRERPPIYGLRYWILRLWSTRHIEKSARRLVAIVRTLGAKFVLTTDHLENSVHIDRNVSGVKIFWIMHGLYLDRFPNSPTREGSYPPQNSKITLFALSKFDLAHYRRWGVIPERVHVVGSLNNSLFKQYSEKFPRPSITNRPTYEICLVEKGMVLEPDREHRIIYRQIWMDVLNLLSNYLKKSNRSIIIAMSNSSEQRQIQALFRSMLGSEISFADSGGRWATYQASDDSELTIGLASTTLLESLNRGNKILNLNTSSFPNYDFPGEGLHRLGSEAPIDSNLFGSRIDKLISMSHAEYFSELPSELKSMIMDDALALETVSDVISSNFVRKF